MADEPATLAALIEAQAATSIGGFAAMEEVVEEGGS